MATVAPAAYFLYASSSVTVTCAIQSAPMILIL
jgi:hypothetical protein